LGCTFFTKIFFNNVVIEKSEPIPFDAKKPKELVVISGKGGTGKTSIATASLAPELRMSEKP